MMNQRMPALCEKSSALLEWGEPQDMRLAPRDGRQIMLLLSNGWMMVARYPEDAGRELPENRWNVWWRVTGHSDVIDPPTIEGKPTGLWPVGWWNMPDSDWAWETAMRLRGED